MSVAIVSADYAEVLYAYDTSDGSLLASEAYDYGTGGIYYVVGMHPYDSTRVVLLGVADSPTSTVVVRVVDEDLATVWEWSGEREMGHINTRPAAHDGIVYWGAVNDAGGSIYVQAVDSGGIVWEASSITVSGASTAWTNGPSIVHDGTRLWVGVGRHVTALDASDGSVLGQYEWANAEQAYGVRLTLAAGRVVAVATVNEVVFARAFTFAGGVLNAGAAVEVDAPPHAVGGSVLLTNASGTSEHVYATFEYYDAGQLQNGRLIRFDAVSFAFDWGANVSSSGGDIYGFYGLGVSDDGPVVTPQVQSGSAPLAFIRDASSGSSVRTMGAGAATEFGLVAVLGDAGGGSAPGVTTESTPVDRLRASINADSGSILASVRAVPFDASHSISFNPTGRLDQQTAYSFREVTRAQDSSDVDAVFYPRATQNQAFEHSYDGVTFLSLMARVFPPALVGQADTLGLEDNTAVSWITYAFTQWAAEYPWFDFETVPDLRHPVPGAAGVATPSEYEGALVNAGLGVVRSNAISFPQDDNNRLTMLEILESLLSPFPGTVYFVDSSGRLQLVPAYGPDADETAFVTLTTDMVSDVSLGEPDAGAIVNRATVASRGLTTGFGAVMEPAWFQIGARDLFGELVDDNSDRVWYDPRAAATNLQPPADGDLVLQEELSPSDAFAAQAISGWQVADPSLFAASSIGLVDETDAPLVTAAYKQFNSIFDPPAFADSGTGTLTLTRNDVPTDGVWRRTLDWSTSVGLINFQLYLDARWNAGAQAVEWRVGSGSGDLAYNDGLANRIRLVVEFTLDDYSEGFTEQTGANVTYGVEGDALFDTSISESQDAFGVLEERLDVRGYYLSAAQALDIAQGYVLANITPRATRLVDLGWLGSTRVLFDYRGRRIELPNGDVGRLVGVSYADDFVSVSGGKSVRVEVDELGAPGAIDTSIVRLLNDDYSFWQNDDGSISEVP